MTKKLALFFISADFRSVETIGELLCGTLPHPLSMGTNNTLVQNGGDGEAIVSSHFIELFLKDMLSSVSKQALERTKN